MPLSIPVSHEQENFPNSTQWDDLDTTIDSLNKIIVGLAMAAIGVTEEIIMEDTAIMAEMVGQVETDNMIMVEV